MAKFCQFSVNRGIFKHFVMTLYILEIAIMVREKSLKIKDFHNASLACIIKSISLFLVNLGFEP